MLKHHSLALAAACLLSSSLCAQHWMGAMDSNWNNPANWSSWPLDGEDVTIDPALYSGVQASPVLGGGSAFVPDRLFAQNGAQVSLQAGLTVSDRFIVGADAVVTMSGGNLIADRLILEAGGSFLLTSGTVTTSSVLALGDDGTLPSTFTQQGGTVNATGEFGFDVELLPSTPTYRLVSGSLTVNGDAVWFGASPGNGQGRLLIEGGNAMVNGSVMNTAGSTVDLYIAISGGELYVNGPALDLAHTTDSLVQNAGDLVLDNALVLENDGVVRATNGDLLVYGDAELRGVGTFLFHDVTISAGGNLQHTAPDEVQVGGHWMRSGTFDAVTNTVAFVGGSAQTVSATDFHGLRLAHTGPGVSLEPGITTVGGSLVLDNGLLFTSDMALLEVQHTATATAGSPTSHVDGPLRKVGNDDFVFPVGKNGSWRRIAISGINDQDTEFTAEYLDSGYGNTTSLEPGLASVNTTEHWRLQRAVTTDQVQVQLFWEDAAASGITDCATLAVAHWNGGAWAGAAGTTTGSCIGNDAGTVQSSDPVPDYDVFTFGTSDGTLGLVPGPAPMALIAHPQPADDQVCIPLPAGTTGITVFDLTGQSITHQRVSDTSVNGLRMDTASLPAGMYLVQASGHAQVLATGRLVVAH